jgi:DNA-binding beta-propeller fold protein YncE
VKFKVGKFLINGLALDNEFIYVTSISSVFKYSLQKETRGRLISSFELKNNPESQLARRLAIFRNEIFIVDHAYACVEVYSKEGKFLRKWGKRGKNPGEFRDPWGIAVAEERVYVVDAGNTRIQVFNLSGDYLFQCQPPNTRKRWDLADICISDAKETDVRSTAGILSDDSREDVCERLEPPSVSL